MEINENQLKSIEINRNQLKSMEINGDQCKAERLVQGLGAQDAPEGRKHLRHPRYSLLYCVEIISKCIRYLFKRKETCKENNKRQKERIMATDYMIAVLKH